MNIDAAFPSKYLKASDLPDDGSALPFTIEEVRTEEVGKEKQIKPIIYFKDQEKGFVCNATNKNTIKKVLGTAETDDWAGKTILLYSCEVQFGDEMVESIRVKLKPGKSTPAAKQSAEDMEVPF